MTEGSRQRGRGLITVLIVVLVAAGLYAGAALWSGDKIPSGTSIGGVPVGGLSPQAAEERLRARLADEEARPITVRAGSQEVEIDPQEAGLRYDYAGSVDGYGGFSANPVDLVTQVFGGSEHPVEVSVDEEELRSAVADAAQEVDREPVEGKVRLEGADVRTTDSKAGLRVDQDALVEDIREGWPKGEDFTAETREVAPDLTQAEIDTFVGEQLRPRLAGPVTVKSTDPAAKGKNREISFTVPPERLAEALRVRSKDGALDLQVSDKELVRAVQLEAEDSGEFAVARDASVRYDGGGKYSIEPSAQGLALKEGGMADTVAQAMTKEGRSARTVTLDSKVTDADFTTKQAKRTLPKEKISTFTTHLTPDAERTENIEIAARTLNGTYVKPGGTFSLNRVLGERTAAKGYNAAPVIENGRLTKDYGGGISQLSTTLFNAVFFSGAKIEEFHPHSFYISRYPEGREATISWPNVDNRFTNDTGAGILIQAKVEGDDVTVTFHGRKAYDEIKAKKGPRRNVKQPEEITDDSKGCVPQSPSVGFDVTVERIFIKDGKTVKTSDFTTHYIPEDHVTCTG